MVTHIQQNQQQNQINQTVNRRKKVLRDKIGTLGTTEHEEIFKILNGKSVDYTQNRNGFFFNLSAVEVEVVEQIEKFVEFCINNQTNLDEYEQHIAKCKLDHNYNKISKGCNPLGQVMANESSKELKDDWSTILTEAKANEKVMSFAHLLENNVANITRKSSANKFFNAKKKFAKRNTKNDHEIPSVLVKEPFIFTPHLKQII